jgi:hypothetical protein
MKLLFPDCVACVCGDGVLCVRAICGFLVCIVCRLLRPGLRYGSSMKIGGVTKKR